ncbi:hypothetical protein [Aureispira sp. CCB-E]|uniref:hypothetical protein n=1 Tax=Aureispira sp. CCB-E TaxID=3051121 RepID=UPI00286978AF|nr:hypothetical protein [Aureispira sp. CCB-E]WMX17488.1 hypothetical protein QP953_13990 [Aureispira sp. CCB-E]
MAQEQGGMGGGIWGSLIDGIFDSVGKAQDMDAANQAFDRVVFMQPGKYNQGNQDVIIFVGLLLILGLVIFFLK